ncbi:MAG: MOSC domain-containing protein [Deltaproteobacteria bacterium]|nr:MOSC domain-containing protein [Deltaproteobacteria bacterium]HCH63990.1 MOSC domain-containing protein [Deltaproteobacteria bacterium]
MSAPGPLAELRATIPQQGRLEAIYTAPKRRAPLASHTADRLEVGTGLATDHHSKRRPGGKRQVSLIQAEHLPAIAALSGHDHIDPALLRRNLVVSGIPLTALRGRRFTIGEALLEGTVLCHPCSRMETLLGPGGYNAMRGMGGLCARVLHAGSIAPGDPICALPDVPSVHGSAPVHMDDDVDE